ncbi:hypothetical protein, partial [Photobacterium sanctipauli]
PLLQPNGREARIAVYQQHQEKRNGQPGKPKWKVKLTLPIATNDSLEATANWNGEQLDLLFESGNGHVIRKTEQLAPLLEARLEMLGLKANSIQYNQLEPAPLTPTATTTSGILVTV